MASGATLILFNPNSFEPPASNGAQPDVRNNHPVLDFDAATDEVAYFTGVMPRNYSGSGLTVYLHTAYSSATSGNAVWGVAFERIGNEQQDLDANGFGPEKTVTVPVPSTTGLVTIDSISFSNESEIDNIAAGDAFRIAVYRRGLNASDTASGDGELVMVEIKET